MPDRFLSSRCPSGRIGGGAVGRLGCGLPTNSGFGIERCGGVVGLGAELERLLGGGV